MSSIYKKGRDGYYYYQTYIYNPDSNKKDKRVFHALRTKDLDEAKKKQLELDNRYEVKGSTSANSTTNSISSNYKSIIAFTFAVIIATLFITNLFTANTYKEDVSSTISNKKISAVDKGTDFSDSIQINSVQIDSAIQKVSGLKTMTIKEEHVEPKVIVPKYTIERVEKLSGPFNQGKIYVTIDEKTSDESQLFLCKELMKRYNEFSNILICIYADNSFGKDLAQGNEEIISIKEQKSTWLSMYTYNKVEGEYFDHNPTSYLGVY
tara:strand:- start:23810 stop:24604 length:795 start_codon:yes stop_codon:yes gene_type:complete